MQLLWFIPTHGEGRYLGTAIGGRTVNFDYWRQIAQAVDHLGFTGALLPTGRSCEDAWVLASALVTHTKRMRFLVAIRPGLMSPGVAARMAATFDRISGGRLLINVVTGGDPVELAGDGLHLDHDDRSQLQDEFLTVWRQIAASETALFPLCVISTSKMASYFFHLYRNLIHLCGLAVLHRLPKKLPPNT
jgi:alkanesulfonate monooxygenase